MPHSTRKLTTEEFIAKAKAVHGDKYDYSKTEYSVSHRLVTIICQIHGEFEQTAGNHLKYGCSRCRGLDRRLTTEEFIAKAKDVHGNKYDYSQTEYINAKIRLKIICHEHGVFEQRPRDHLDGSDCPKCSLRIRLSKITSSTEEFITKAKAIHGDKYDYSKTIYVSSFQTVKIICSVHGVFEQVATDHLKGSTCKKCSTESTAEKRRLTTEEFIAKAKDVHGNKYDYSLTQYVDSRHKVKIACSQHGEFEQNAAGHLLGEGCPLCKSSKGELAVIDYLKGHGYQYRTQVKFEDCKGIRRRLPFDFQVTLKNSLNILIEVDGDHHRQFITHFKQAAFISTLRNDTIKTAYCLANNIPLIRLEYLSHALDGKYMSIKDRISHVVRQLEEALAKYEALPQVTDNEVA